MVKLVVKVKVFVHRITVHISMAAMFIKVLPVVNEVSVLDLPAWNLGAVVGVKFGFKHLKLCPLVIHEGGVVCFTAMPVSVKPVDVREDSVIHVKVKEGVSMLSIHMVICMPHASFKAAAMEERVPETSF